MTRIDFYRIPGSLEPAIELAGELLARACNEGLDVLVHCAESSVFARIAPALGRFCDSRAIPCKDSIGAGAGVTFSDQDHPGGHCGLLINFGLAVPRWFGRFEKLTEIIYDDPLIQERRRVNYRFFRDRGYPLRFRDLSGSAIRASQ